MKGVIKMITKNGPYEGTYWDEDTRLMVQTDMIDENEENPRDSVEMTPDDPAFLSLVEDIMGNSNINHTPIQVYYKDRKFKLIAGHRRLRAIQFINKRNLKNSPTHIFATLMPEPKTKFDERKMMFSAEETSKRWGDVRKFIFFRDMLKELIQRNQDENLITNPEHLVQEMKRATSMTASTVTTFYSFAENPVISDAMASLDSELPRSGRMKSLRSCVRGMRVLTTLKPSVVRKLTNTNDALSVEAQRRLAEHFVIKLKNYIRLALNHGLSIGPGIAMERTVTEFNMLRGGELSESELMHWFDDKDNIFRPHIIGQSIRQKVSNKELSFTAYIKSYKHPKVGARTSEEVVNKYLNDYLMGKVEVDKRISKYSKRLSNMRAI